MKDVIIYLFLLCSTQRALVAHTCSPKRCFWVEGALAGVRGEGGGRGGEGR